MSLVGLVIAKTYAKYKNSHTSFNPTTRPKWPSQGQNAKKDANPKPK
jgi:hypothetical protein